MTNSFGNHNDEFDLNLFLKPLIRNKLLIGSISLISFVIGCLYSLALERVWEGQFQIVLLTKNNEPNQNFFDQDIDLATEVQKLKSPSVLMPIFEFARSSANKNSRNYSNYIKWTKNLDIQLLKKTSVLNISYRDKNKENIVPILEKMSDTYQEYSNLGKKRSSELQINYLKEQVSLYKEKSNNSLRIAQEFATNEDLIFYDMNLAGMRRKNLMPQNNPNIILPNVNIENIRVEAANQIRKINIQLEKFNSIIDYEELKGFGATIPGLLENTAPEKIEKLEEDIAVLRSKYTEEDPTIKRLLIEKKQLIELLKQRANNYLIAQKSQAEAIIESVKRPKEVLMKYKELIREASRDENTLIGLEMQLREIELESAKREEPWELITQPTLLNNPVAPSRKAIGFRSLIVGIIIGSAYVFFKEKNSGLIYDSEVIKKFIPTRIISKIKLKDIYKKEKEFLFLKDYLEKNSTSTISFLVSEGIESNDLESFKNGIKKNKLNFYKDLKDIEPSQNQNSKYLILKLGFTKISEITNFKNYNDLLQSQIEGVIVFEDNNLKSIGDVDNKIKLKSKSIFINLYNFFSKFLKIK